MRAESFSATEPAGRDVPVDTAGVCSDVLWNEYCAAWLSVRIMATIAAALKNGAKRSFIVTRRAFTVSGSSISAIMRVGVLLRLLVDEEAAILLKLFRDAQLAEERAEYLLFFESGLALPVAVQELTDVFIIHNCRIAEIVV